MTSAFGWDGSSSRTDFANRGDQTQRSVLARVSDSAAEPTGQYSLANVGRM
jgi:hypothetical protein